MNFTSQKHAYMFLPFCCWGNVCSIWLLTGERECKGDYRKIPSYSRAVFPPCDSAIYTGMVINLDYEYIYMPSYLSPSESLNVGVVLGTPTQQLTREIDKRLRKYYAK